MLVPLVCFWGWVLARVIQWIFEGGAKEPSPLEFMRGWEDSTSEGKREHVFQEGFQLEDGYLCLGCRRVTYSCLCGCENPAPVELGKVLAPSSGNDEEWPCLCFSGRRLQDGSVSMCPSCKQEKRREANEQV